MFLLNLYIFIICGERMECIATRIIKFTEEFSELKTVRMYICTQKVDTQIEYMSEDHNDNECLEGFC